MSKFKEIRKTTVNLYKNVSPDLYVDHYGHEVCAPDKLPVDSSIPLYRLHFIKKGKCHIFVNHKKILLPRNSVFILIPSSDISYSILPEVETEIYWVAYSGYMAETITNSIGLNKQSPFLTLHTALKLKLFQQNFYSYPENELARHLVFQKNLLEILQTIFSQSEHTNLEKRTQTLQSSDSYIHQTLEIINQNLSNHFISISSVAEQLHLHPNYLSNLFKKALGMSFTTYITQRRIDYALLLIDRGYTKVNEIARAVGFNDPYFFSKTFKKICGVSPIQAIKSAQNKPQ